MERSPEYRGERHRVVDAVLQCAHCKASNKITFVPYIPGDDELDESRVFKCELCGNWNQIVTEYDGFGPGRKHATEPLDRRPARKGTSGSRPWSSAFETNRRRH